MCSRITTVSRDTSHVTTKHGWKYTASVDIQNPLWKANHIQNHVRQECSESARERRIALYKRDHHHQHQEATSRTRTFSDRRQTNERTKLTNVRSKISSSLCWLILSTFLTRFGRKCNKTRTIKGITIPTGSSVMVNIYGLMKDEDYFPEPEKFIPERCALHTVFFTRML